MSPNSQSPRRKFPLVWSQAVSHEVRACRLSVQSHLALRCCLEPGAGMLPDFTKRRLDEEKIYLAYYPRYTSGGALLRPCHLPRRPRQIYRRP